MGLSNPLETIDFPSPEKGNLGVRNNLIAVLHQIRKVHIATRGILIDEG